MTTNDCAWLLYAYTEYALRPRRRLEPPAHRHESHARHFLHPSKISRPRLYVGHPVKDKALTLHVGYMRLKQRAPQEDDGVNASHRSLAHSPGRNETVDSPRFRAETGGAGSSPISGLARPSYFQPCRMAGMVGCRKRAKHAQRGSGQRKP